jgi:hypothetical protein
MYVVQYLANYFFNYTIVVLYLKIGHIKQQSL